MTIAEFLKEIETVFIKSGILCPEREALLLACHVLSVDQVYIFTHKDEYIDEKILLASAALINERCKGRPLAYIMGTANFCGIDLAVDERVLIPRPETELMVEDILSEVSKGQKADNIIDMCTGSGCIAMALADRLKESKIVAADLSIKAYQLASVNCRTYGNIKVVRSDLFEKIDETFDIIVSNPPYIANSDRSWMQKEVKDYEPEMALFAGEEGLDVIKPLVTQACEHLKSGGLFYMEIGENQSEKVIKLVEDTGKFEFYEINKDLSGLDRFLKAKKA